MIPEGEGNVVVHPSFFVLDKSLNILITDFESNCVSVFSFGGELIHRFGKEGKKRGEFLNPRGISIDIEGRILVDSQNPENCIQIFGFLTVSYYLTFVLHSISYLTFTFLILSPNYI